MNKRPKKLNKDQQRRLKELDNLQQSLQDNLELGRERVREEAEAYKRGEMRTITEPANVIEAEYKKERKDAEQAKDRAIRAANKAFSEAETAARAKKREELASIEEEIENLEQEVERRVAKGDADLQKEFNEKLQKIVQERQAIRGGDEPKVPDVPDSQAVPTAEPEKADGETVGVP